MSLEQGDQWLPVLIGVPTDLEAANLNYLSGTSTRVPTDLEVGNMTYLSGTSTGIPTDLEVGNLNYLSVTSTDSAEATDGDSSQSSIVPGNSGPQDSTCLNYSKRSVPRSTCGALKKMGVSLLIGKPSRWCFLADTILYYCTQVFAFVSGIIFLSERKWASGIVSLSSTILPGMVLGLHAFLSLSGRTGVSYGERVWLLVKHSLNISRGLEARNYLRGSEPMWLYISADKHARLALCLLPSISINMAFMPHLDHSERESLYFCVTSAMTLLSAGFSASIDHFIEGPPLNLQEYRIWDMEHAPLCEAVAVTLIDFCSSSHRIILLAVVLLVSDVQTYAALLFTPAFLHAMLTWSHVKALWPSSMRAMLIVGLNSFVLGLIHDMFWLEPAPIHAPGLQFALPLRLLQMFYGGWIILAKWDTLLARADSRIWYLVAYGVGCAVIYLTVCPVYLYARRDRMSRALDLTTAFVASEHEHQRHSQQVHRVKSAEHQVQLKS